MLRAKFLSSSYHHHGFSGPARIAILKPEREVGIAIPLPARQAYDEIAYEILRLRELRQQTTIDTAARDEQIKRINDLQDYIAQQNTYLTEFDESLVRRWIKQITIWDDHITVELKSGLKVDVER